MNEDKFLRSQERKARARAEALQCLVPLPSPPESAPESQAEHIADTPEAEPEPAEAHELTGRALPMLQTLPPATGVAREMATSITMSWRQCTMVPPHAGMTGMRVSSRRQLQNITQCRAHPTATSDEPGTGTGMVPDATTVSQLEAMLDEPEADAGAAPDASPATELRLLQSPDPEQTTLMRDTPLAEQAEHSPRVESSPPSDASLPGPPEPGYSSSETPPLPDPEYSSSSLLEEANDREPRCRSGCSR